jgi:hypothetical protein
MRESTLKRLTVGMGLVIETAFRLKLEGAMTDALRAQ